MLSVGTEFVPPYMFDAYVSFYDRATIRGVA
jgi:hypothetical protein